MQEREKNKILVKGIAIYAIGTFGTKVLSVLIVPLYTYYISTSDMGVYDILVTTIGLLTPLVTFQISDAAYRWMVRGDQVNECIKSTFRVLIVNSIIASLIIFVINCTIITIPYCGLFVLMLITSRAYQTTLKLLRGLKNQKLFALSSILYSAIYLCLNFLFIAVLHLGVSYLFISQIVSNLVTVLAMFMFERRLWFRPFSRTNFPLIKQMLAYSIPLVPNLLNWWVMSSSDRYIITICLGSAFNGIYAISYKFPTLLQQVLSLFNSSWQDLSISEDERDEKYYSNVFYRLYRFSFSLIPIAITGTHIFIRVFMHSSYHEASRYVSFLFLGTIFQVFSAFFGVGYLRNKNTIQASLTSIYGAVINIVVNLAFIKWIGLYAAAISTFCGFFVMWIVRYFQTRDSLGIVINWGRFYLLFASALLISIASLSFTFRTDIIIGLISIVWFIIWNKEVLISLLSVLQRYLFFSRR